MIGVASAPPVPSMIVGPSDLLQAAIAAAAAIMTTQKWDLILPSPYLEVVIDRW
jgi:hypothetical protein